MESQKVSNIDRRTSVSVHIGNSDIVADFVYQDREQIVDAIVDIVLFVIEKLIFSNP